MRNSILSFLFISFIKLLAKFTLPLALIWHLYFEAGNVGYQGWDGKGFRKHCKTAKN